MSSIIDCITFDCADARRLSDFWAVALGYEDETVEDGWIALRPAGGAGPLLGFQRVPEPKVAKNRVHLDLKPSAGTMEGEVARLESLGARRIRLVGAGTDGEHLIMTDPEGNEFCMVRE